MMVGHLPNWVVGALVRWRTVPLEAFLSVEAMACGAWALLWPSDSLAGTEAFADVPETVVGSVMLAHGIASAWVLWRRDVTWCRRSALASFGLWLYVTAAFVLTWLSGETPSLPQAAPGLTVPIAAVLALASLWVYMRLYLRWGPRAPRESVA